MTAPNRLTPRITRQQLIRLRRGRAAEQRHLFDPADMAFAQLATQHPEKCSTDADYPTWTPGGTR